MFPQGVAHQGGPVSFRALRGAPNLTKSATGWAIPVARHGRSRGGRSFERCDAPDTHLFAQNAKEWGTLKLSYRHKRWATLQQIPPLRRSSLWDDLFRSG